jgi:hypothetical protein
MKKITPFKLILIISLIVIVLIFLPYDYIDGIEIFGFRLNTKDYDKLGEFIGGITAPIAIVLLYLTYNSQKEELRSTQNVFKTQTSIMQKQQDDASFFALLENHRRFVESFDRTKNKPKYRIDSKSVEHRTIEDKGYALFENIAHELLTYVEYYQNYIDRGISGKNIFFDKPHNFVLTYFPECQELFDEVKNIVSFIERVDQNKGDYLFYLKTLESVLREYEKIIIILFIHFKHEKISYSSIFDSKAKYVFTVAEHSFFPVIELNGKKNKIIIKTEEDVTINYIHVSDNKSEIINTKIQINDLLFNNQLNPIDIFKKHYNDTSLLSELNKWNDEMKIIEICFRNNSKVYYQFSFKNFKFKNNLPLLSNLDFDVQLSTLDDSIIENI